MRINVFAKARTTRDGKPFTAYVGRLTNSTTGESVTVGIRFRQDCGAPRMDDCPCVVEVEKKHANLDTREIINPETGDITISRTLWVNAWEMVGEYEDHSLDDYE